jgi:hypothetical protein
MVQLCCDAYADEGPAGRFGRGSRHPRVEEAKGHEAA